LETGCGPKAGCRGGALQSSSLRRSTKRQAGSSNSRAATTQNAQKLIPILGTKNPPRRERHRRVVGIDVQEGHPIASNDRTGEACGDRGSQALPARVGVHGYGTQLDIPLEAEALAPHWQHAVAAAYSTIERFVRSVARRSTEYS
jgi:hypothetical protein